MTVNTDDKSAVGDFLTSVLDGVVGVFEQANVSLPEKRYIAAGPVAHDCEQVTVSFIQMYLGAIGAPADQPQRCDSPRVVVLTAQVVRCVPTSGTRTTTGPAAATMNANTLTRMQDAWLLMEAGANAVDTFGLGVLANVTTTDPQGGFQATVLDLVAAVP